MEEARKFIAWDWNGTVLDDVGAAHGAFNEAIVSMSKPPVTLEQYREAYDFPITNIFVQLGLLKDEVEANLPSMMAVFHRHFEVLSRLITVRKDWPAFDPVFVKRKFRNVILSNHLTPLIHAQATNLGVIGQFDHILSNASFEEQIRKTSKGERLRHYMQTHKLSPQDGIIIGDTPEEAHIGRELGITCALISGGYASEKRLEAAQPDYLIHSLSELTPILQERGYLA